MQSIGPLAFPRYRSSINPYRRENIRPSVSFSPDESGKEKPLQPLAGRIAVSRQIRRKGINITSGLLRPSLLHVLLKLPELALLGHDIIFSQVQRGDDGSPNLRLAVVQKEG